MNATSPFAVDCPSCGSEFPVDPAKVPTEGIPAICSVCQRIFPVVVPWREESVEPSSATPSHELPADGESPEDARASMDSALPEGDEVSAKDTLSEIDEVASDSGPVADDWSPFEDLSSLATEVGAQEETGDGTEPASHSLSKGVERFGRRDVHERARHLARVLVSDIIAYHPVRYQESFARGTLKEDFEAEVQKSWKEYVDQVGSEMAESTPYFNDALNHVLAKGERVF